MNLILRKYVFIFEKRKASKIQGIRIKTAPSFLENQTILLQWFKALICKNLEFCIFIIARRKIKIWF